MGLLTVSKVYGAKCDISKKDICIATRSFYQTDSNVTLIPKKPLNNLKLTLDTFPKNFFEMDISVLTKDGKTRHAGKITNHSSFVNILFNDTLIEKIILTMKNTTKEESRITLKSHAA